MKQTEAIIPGLLKNFRTTWRRLLATHVIYNFTAFALLTPLATLLLRLFISLSGEAALADEDILFFILRPSGLFALMVLGSLFLAILALEHAALMTIGFAATHGRQIHYMDALFYVSRCAWAVLRLIFQVIARVLLYTAPFIAANALTFFLFLTKHDINYYLFEKPPVFWVTAISITLISSAVVIILLRLVAGWAFALPSLLFSDVPPSNALRSSTLKASGRRLWIIGWFLVWFLSWAVLAGIASGITGALGSFLIPRVVGTIGLLSLALGALLLFGVLLNAAVVFLNISTLSLLMVRLYLASGLDTSFDFLNTHLMKRHSMPGRLRISGKTALWGCAGGVVVASFVGFALIQGLSLEDRVQIVAHRGASAAAPENTLAAVELAIVDGADWVEIDVQETGDGRIVVIHDSDLKKVAGNDLRIRDAVLDQLQSIDIGSWFGSEFANQRVPTLEQVLETCRGRIKVNIELKYYGSEKSLAGQSIALVEAADMTTDVAMMSLNYDGIMTVREMRPDWKIGFLAAASVGDLTKRDVDFLAVSANLATRPFVRRAHRRGKKVLVWTVNDPIGMSTMISRGVDAIITDEPALARSVLIQRAELSPPERLLVELAVLFGRKPRYVEQ